MLFAPIPRSTRPLDTHAPVRTVLRAGSALLLGVLALSGALTAHAQEGMASVPSPHDVATTMDRLESVLAEKGMTVFVRVDHAAGAGKAGFEIPPTELLLFGNPAVGTPLMICAPSIAIDLPQKMLAWQDASGATRLGWNDPAYLKSRHGIEGCDEALAKVAGALNAFAAAATAE